MPVSRGLLLIDAILREGRLRPVLDAGITPEMLDGPSHQALEYILHFANQPYSRGAVPPREQILQMIPVLEWPPQQDQPPPLEVVTELVVQDHLRRTIEEFTQNIRNRAARDPKEALAYARQRLSEPFGVVETTNGHQDVDMTATMYDTVAKHHETIHEHEGIVGVPWPWEILNKATMGIHDGDTVVFYGIPKSMKTWLALYVGAYAYMHTQSKVVFFSPEMRLGRTQLRLASLLTGTNYSKVQYGFKPEEWKEQRDFFEMLYNLQQAEEMQDKRGRRLIYASGLVSPASGDAISAISAKIDMYEPKILILDSAYHLTSDLDWKVISQFTQAISRIGRDTGVIIVLVYQENEKDAVKMAHAGRNPRASTMMFSQGPIQDCDVGIRVVKKAHGKGFLLSLHLTAAREMTLNGFTVYGNPGHNLEFYNAKRISLQEALEEDGDPKPRPTRVNRGPDVYGRSKAWDNSTDQQDKS